MSDYFIVPLFVFDKHMIFILFSTNYKLQVFRLEFEMPCHRTICYFKGCKGSICYCGRKLVIIIFDFEMCVGKP